MFWRKFFSRMANSKTNWLVYLAEICLIIFSILVAMQADRYRQNIRSENKLDDYLRAMYQDLLIDQRLNQNNLADCLNDIKNIEASMRLSQINQSDSLSSALQNFGAVISRGVFRAFPPTTYDIMISTGDIGIIKDLEFRSRLAGAFSFRADYVKKDLLAFDALTDDVARSLGQYGNLSCMVSTPEPQTCLRDRPGFIDNFNNELFLLLTNARSRAYHLRIATRYFEATIKKMEEMYDLQAQEEENSDQ
ncbi:MAG: hypothetical protein HRU41_33270 [Saprospiraceae bacterium]|nr:hypothetical protein [Saprospiraceae bacterium]